MTEGERSLASRKCLCARRDSPLTSLRTRKSRRRREAGHLASRSGYRSYLGWISYGPIVIRPLDDTDASRRPETVAAAEMSLRSLVKQSRQATVPWQQRPSGHFEPPSD